MKMEANALLMEYPYFSDGQFEHENIQESQAAQYFQNIQSNKTDFINISDTGLVHAKMLKWDSEHFGMPMGRIEHFYFKEETTIANTYRDLSSWFDLKQAKHISIRLNLRNRNAINFLANRGFEFITGKLLLRADLQGVGESTQLHAEYKFSKDLEKGNQADLIKIASNNFNENRFMLDEYLDRRQSTLLYENWVKQEIEKAAGNLIIMRKDNETVGFALLDKLAPVPSFDFGFINLIAVNKRFQGQGFGKILLNKALCKFKTQNIEKVLANVVSTNYASLALFQSCDFKIYSSLLEMRKYKK